MKNNTLGHDSIIKEVENTENFEYIAFTIEEEGTIGNFRYELRCISSIDNIYEVIIFSEVMGLAVVTNSGLVACQAFIEGMRIGKCRNIGSAASKKLGFSEYGGDPREHA